MTEHEMDDLFDEDWPDDHRSGIIAVVGRPNAGKSTLINAILQQKIAIVTNKPQTTRRQQLGIYTTEHAQLLFVDTPGLHKPHNLLGEYMTSMAESALKDADIVLWVLDTSSPVSDGERIIAERLGARRGGARVILALNKIDLLAPETDLDDHLNLIEHLHAAQISALEGTGVTELVSYLVSQMPLGPRYYPADQVSEVNMRFIAAEAIRERVIEHTEEEIPYSIAVLVDEFKERSEDMTYISATIYVERESQKGIIIGKGGAMIKTLGTEARTTLAEIIGTRVYLDLHVKTLKNWRSDAPLLRRLGYFVPDED